MKRANTKFGAEIRKKFFGPSIKYFYVLFILKKIKKSQNFINSANTKFEAEIQKKF